MNSDLKPLIGKLTIFAKDRMGFSYPPKLFLKKDVANSHKMLGRTAHYDPQQQAITLYVSGRHPKDILRSYAHELVHHVQNLRGDLNPEKMGAMGNNYAQDNDHMRNMEKEAYLKGNMCFRDFEDGLEDEDRKMYKLAESKFIKENKIMTKNKIKEITGLGDMARAAADKPELSTLEAEAMVRTMIDMFTDDNDGFGVMQTLDNMGDGMGRGKGNLGGEAFNALNQVYDALLKANNRHHSQQNADNETPPEQPEDIEESKYTKENKTVTKKLTNESLKEMIEQILEGELKKAAPLKVKRTAVDTAKYGGGRGEPVKIKDLSKKKKEVQEEQEIEEGGCQTSPGIRKDKDIEEAAAKPDFPDVDGDGNTKEPISKAQEDKEEKEGKSDNKDDKKQSGKPKKGEIPPQLRKHVKGKTEESKIQTPEQENTLYEQRFTPKNTRLYEKLVKQWTK